MPLAEPDLSIGQIRWIRTGDEDIESISTNPLSMKKVNLFWRFTPQVYNRPNSSVLGQKPHKREAQITRLHDRKSVELRNLR